MKEALNARRPAASAYKKEKNSFLVKVLGIFRNKKEKR